MGDTDGSTQSSMAVEENKGNTSTQPSTTTGENRENTSTQSSTMITEDKGNTSTQMSATPACSMQMSSMESRQLHSGQQEALKKIPEFSGEDNEQDIDEWLFDLTNLFSFMRINDETKVLETMGKLTGPALKWYQQHLPEFESWEQIEEALQERFKEPTSDSHLVREFLQLYQEENQSIISFYELVVRKYRRIRKFITEQQVITVLQNGVKNSLKEHLIRKEREADSLEKWLQLAREEEYIQKRLQQNSEDVGRLKPEPLLPAATINTRPMRPNHAMDGRRPNERKYEQWRKKPDKNDQQKKKCLVCNRQNHSTNQCLYKKESGCYKCGQSDHQIRNCPKRRFFE